MLKIKTKLYIYNDKFKEEYPVIILDGNIKPVAPNGLPGCADERVNFRYQCRPTYKDISKNLHNKVNTRFKYPFAGGYKKSGREGFCEAYANLNFFQKIKLSIIARNTFYHQHKVASIFIILNILGFIPLWVSLLFPRVQSTNQQPDQNNIQSTKQHITANKAVILDSLSAIKDSMKFDQQIDTLQVKEKSTKQ